MKIVNVQSVLALVMVSSLAFQSCTRCAKQEETPAPAPIEGQGLLDVTDGSQFKITGITGDEKLSGVNATVTFNATNITVAGEGYQLAYDKVGPNSACGLSNGNVTPTTGGVAPEVATNLNNALNNNTLTLAKAEGDIYTGTVNGLTLTLQKQF